MLKLSIFLIALFSVSIIRVSSFNIFGNMPNVFDLSSQIQKQVNDMIEKTTADIESSDSSDSSFSGGSSSSSFSSSSGSGSGSNGVSRTKTSGQNSKGVKYSRETIEWTNGTTLHRIEKINYPTLGKKKQYHYTVDLTDEDAEPVLVTKN